MIWGIIGALSVEVELIKNSLTLEKTETHFGSVYYVGDYKGQQVVVVQCGIGKINAATCAFTLLDRFKVDCLVNVGIAGALDPRLHTLDVVVGNQVLFHDIDHETYMKYHPFETVFSCDKKLVDACIQVLGNMTPPVPYYVGLIATGDEFVESSQLKKEIISNFNPLCVEMEGAAIAQVAFMNNTPFLVLRTMSDSADDNAKETYDNLFDTAAQVSAKIILQLLSISSST